MRERHARGDARASLLARAFSRGEDRIACSQATEGAIESVRTKWVMLLKLKNTLILIAHQTNNNTSLIHTLLYQHCTVSA